MRGDWALAYAPLCGLVDTPDADPADLDHLADAAWRPRRVQESTAIGSGRTPGTSPPARTAGPPLSLDGVLRAPSRRAWLGCGGLAGRARRHLAGQPESVEHADPELAEAFLAQERGDPDAVLRRAGTMAEIAYRQGSADFAAMALEIRGAALLARGEREAGFALIDEAMCPVLAGELSSLFTGWIYCLALPAAIGAVDLRRAAEWTDGAMAWCAHAAGTPFHGLCRVHRVEVLHLRGAWSAAAEEASCACEELLAYDPRIAAEAFYLAGEIALGRGSTEAAETAFRRAHELGRDPQPGLALLRLRQGRIPAAAAALRTALSGAASGTLGRARLRAAQVDVALAAGERVTAQEAADELTAIAQGADPGATLLPALAATARGAVRLAEGEPLDALPLLHIARDCWLDLGLPYHLAEVRMLIAAACRAAGDGDGARLEIEAARAAFLRLGAEPDARRATALLATGPTRPGVAPIARSRCCASSPRAGTTREIASDLAVSDHTVARHLNNIFAKLGVSSRAAATAFAVTHELI